MRKEIEIDGKMVPFRATGATPRIYRNMFNRDIFVDMMHLDTEVGKGGVLNSDSLELFENLAYTMAVQAAKQDGTQLPATPDEWLDTFEVLSIYDILPQLMELWKMNNETLVDSKKK